MTYFEVGVYNPKSKQNIGTLWRSAYQLGASGIFTIGERYRGQPTDTCKAHRHIPLRNYRDINDFIFHVPSGACLIGIEMGGINLSGFSHPKQAIYLLGAEDYGLPENIKSICNCIVSLEAVKTQSYNVAVAGSIVMYHRIYGDL
jgi:tRNA G18 (ribose-2'-O)-methylase SpoU